MGVSLAAIVTLASCNKEIENSTENIIGGGIPFELTASSVETKTAIDGFTTSWIANDALDITHAIAGTTDYVNDGKFTITEETLDAKKFNGTLKSELADDTAYDWYALYPKNDSGSFTYIGHSKGATQKGNNSTAHLCGSLCPLYGIAKNVNSSDPVAFEMLHLATVVEINVTNTTNEDLTVNTITLASSDENIVGSYTIDFKGENVTYIDSDAKYVSKTATLNVVNGEAIPKDGNAKFYIPIKPHVAESGSKIVITVNGYEKEIPLTKDVTFKAGTIKKIRFNYDNTNISYITLPWAEDFSNGVDKYILTNGSSTTKLYSEKLAGGTAPELLVSKAGGCFSANIKAMPGNYLLSYKANNTNLNVSIDNSNIIITKIAEKVYSTYIPDGISSFKISFVNNKSSNTRLDDILLTTDTRTELTNPLNVKASLGSTNNTLTVAWDAVENAASYEVVISATGKDDIIKTASSNSITVDGLEYSTEYNIKVKAISSDIEKYINSDYSAAVTVTTGIEPPYLTITPSEYTKEIAAAGETLTFTVKTNQASWSVSSSDETNFKTAVSGDSFTVTVAANEGESRSATITISAGELSKELTLTQKAAGATETKTGKVSFGSASGSINVKSSSEAGSDAAGTSWTVTTSGTTSFTPSANYSQIGSSKKPASSITIVGKNTSAKKIESVTANFGGFTGTAGTITIKVGNTLVGDGKFNETNDVTINTTTAADGNTITIAITSIAKGIKLYSIEYTYTE